MSEPVDGRPTEPLGAGAAWEVPDALRLEVRAGPQKGASLLLARGTYYVGSGRDCDLHLSDPAVSRRHLEITVDTGGLTIKDLGSKNGSSSGGVRFHAIVVGVGAVLCIGHSELEVCAAAGRPEAERFGDLVANSASMRQLFALLERISASDASVLIEGETGTGKDLCAQALHQKSRRAGGPLTVCDLGSVPRSLIESELFGHVAGAFTGAHARRDGAFVLADHGTLFLDEIGELELEVQPRLLRAIEQRSVKPVGASEYRAVDVRVISATNRDLAAECRAGTFRADLYHRVAVVRVTIPPLRERKEDLMPLLRTFIPAGIELAPEALAILGEYDWPGNVRELRNVVDRGAALCRPGEVLVPSMLGIDGVRTPTSESFHQTKSRLIEEWERDYLRDLLRRSGGNISRAAREAQLHRPYLYRLLKKHGLGER
jgi:DNA-binding NtrC family response regulator